MYTRSTKWDRPLITSIRQHRYVGNNMYTQTETQTHTVIYTYRLLDTQRDTNRHPVSQSYISYRIHYLSSFNLFLFLFLLLSPPPLSLPLSLPPPPPPFLNPGYLLFSSTFLFLFLLYFSYSFLYHLWLYSSSSSSSTVPSSFFSLILPPSSFSSSSFYCIHPFGLNPLLLLLILLPLLLFLLFFFFMVQAIITVTLVASLSNVQKTLLSTAMTFDTIRCLLTVQCRRSSQ